MYQMTLFFKKVIYKNNAPIDMKLHLFFNFSWGSMMPPAKGMASLSCGYMCSVLL